MSTPLPLASVQADATCTDRSSVGLTTPRPARQVPERVQAKLSQVSQLIKHHLLNMGSTATETLV
jgi:hypothetical protein